MSDNPIPTAITRGLRMVNANMKPPFWTCPPANC